MYVNLVAVALFFIYFIYVNEVAVALFFIYFIYVNLVAVALFFIHFIYVNLVAVALFFIYFILVKLVTVKIFLFKCVFQALNYSLPYVNKIFCWYSFCLIVYDMHLAKKHVIWNLVLLHVRNKGKQQVKNRIRIIFSAKIEHTPSC